MTRDHRHVHSAASLDGPSLLTEQTQILSDSTPGEINFLHFLKVRLSAQQRATAQRNYWQRVHHDAEGLAAGYGGGGGNDRSGTATSATSAAAIPMLDAEARAVQSSWSVENTPVHGGAPTAAGGGRGLAHYAGSDLSRSPPEETRTYHSAVHGRGGAGGVRGGSATAGSPHTSFSEMPASAAKRKTSNEVVEASEVLTGAAAAPAASESRNRRRLSSVPHDEEDYVVPQASQHQQQQHANLEPRATAAIDEKPAMASGKPQVPAGVDDLKDVELAPCPHCGRTFAPDRLERHVVLCERQQAQNPKAKAADAKDRRTVPNSRIKPERAAASAKTASSAPSVAATPPPPASASAAAAAAKTEKWRKQSAQVRSAMAGSSVVEDDRVPCPHCTRRFSEDAAARHIPICKAKEERHA